MLIEGRIHSAKCTFLLFCLTAEKMRCFFPRKNLTEEVLQVKKRKPLRLNKYQHTTCTSNTEQRALEIFQAQYMHTELHMNLANKSCDSSQSACFLLLLLLIALHIYPHQKKFNSSLVNSTCKVLSQIFSEHLDMC